MNRARWLVLAIGVLLSGLIALLALRRSTPAAAPSRSPAAGAELELAIVAPGGGPAKGARVSIVRGASVPPRTADVGGTVRLGSLQKGPLHVTVSLPGAARLQRELMLVSGPNRFRIALVTAARLAGVVLDDASAPVAGAAVEAQPEQPPSAAAHAVVADAQGRFVFDDLAPGPYALRARADHHEPAVLPAVDAPSSEGLQLVLERTSTLHGEVIDAAGKPAADAIVTVAGAAFGHRASCAPTRAARSSCGRSRAAFTSCARGAGTKCRDRPKEYMVAPAAATHVSLRLEPGQTLRGSIIDGATGRGLPAVRVRVIEDALSGSNLTAESSANGLFELSGLRDAPHRVWIAAPGYVAVAGQTVDVGASARAGLPIAFALRRARRPQRPGPRRAERPARGGRDRSHGNERNGRAHPRAARARGSPQRRRR